MKINIPVGTKHGELVVHDNDVVTYVGNKHWSISHETMVGKSPDNQKQFVDERKKKRKNDTKRTRNKIKGI